MTTLYPAKLAGVFLSHGGGPLPLLGDPGHHQMVQHLTALARHATRPRVIVVISAHWEASSVAITASPAPPTYHDYYGFPEQLRRALPGAGRARACTSDTRRPE